MVHLGNLLCTAKQSFREAFTLKNKSNLVWYPGHMEKGVKQMQRKLKSVDCIIEMHDARIPFSGRNPEGFQTVSGLRPHILVYNKKDLADDSLESSVIKIHKENGINNVIFTSCVDGKCAGIKKLVPTVQKLILSSCRHNRSENLDYCLMIIGVPNVGKSSLINILRSKYLLQGNAASVGAKPGITISVGERIKISEDPLIYVLDTPGILTPKVPSVENGMKLALCATIPDSQVGIERIADYLLFWMNKHKHFQYLSYVGLENPSDDITEVLVTLAVKNGLNMKTKCLSRGYIVIPDVTLAALRFVSAFRRGLFGKVTLDIDQILFPKKEKSGLIRRTADFSQG